MKSDRAAPQRVREELQKGPRTLDELRHSTGCSQTALIHVLDSMQRGKRVHRERDLKRRNTPYVYRLQAVGA